MSDDRIVIRGLHEIGQPFFNEENETDQPVSKEDDEQ